MTQLNRGLGLSAGIAINVANVIGTGVFLKTRVMTCNVDDPLIVMAVWAAAGLLSLLGAFCYAELASMMPAAGGDYVFLRKAYGRLTSFLYGWTVFAIMKTGSQAALAVGFAIFLNTALGGALDSTWLTLPLGDGIEVPGITIFALGALWIVTFFNCASVTATGGAATLLTVLKVLTVIGVGVGAFAFGSGDFGNFAASASGGTCEGVEASAMGGIAGIGAAMLGALWAYDGWNNVAPLCGEVKDPQRNLPRMFIWGTLLVIVLYVGVNAAYFYVLAPSDVASVSATSSVATEVLASFAGPFAVTFMAAALMLSSLGSLHSSVLANSRVPYAMAADGMFFKPLAKLSSRTRVPVNAVLAQAGWASVLAISGTFDTLTDSVVFASCLFYALSAAAVIIFRVREPDLPRPFRAWGYPFTPVIFVLVSVGLLASALYATPKQALLGVGVIALGVPFYFYWSRQVDARATRE
ncbi:MAG: amino acid permease [Gammaproteobacteria bacterium]|jgi:APA family basic amino acid/polyamine antiporter|nr:amino acid permease [Gammaproteobacteria bacterium]